MKKRILLAALLCLIPVICFAAWTWDGTLITAWDGGAISAWDGQSVTVCTPNTAAISYSSSLPFTVGDANRTITDSCTSGTPALTTNNSGICTIVAGALHAVGAGSCIVYNNCPAGSGYCASVNSQTITVSAPSGTWWFAQGSNVATTTTPPAYNTFETNGSGNQMADIFGQWSNDTAMVGKTITKVGFYLGNQYVSGPATACTVSVMVYANGAGCTVLGSGTTSSLTYNGRNEVSLDSSVVIPSGGVLAAVGCNGNMNLQYLSTAPTYSSMYFNVAYTSWPGSTQTSFWKSNALLYGIALNTN